MAKKLNTRIVTITRVDNYSITHSEGLSVSIRYFPGAKVGQQWKLTTDDAPPFVLGKIVKAELLKDQAA